MNMSTPKDFPKLVIEVILQYLPSRDRLQFRAVSSEWNAVVGTRFRDCFPRAILTSTTAFTSFIQVFKNSQFGVPFSRYVLSLRELSNESFEKFASFTVPWIRELSVAPYGDGNSIVWGGTFERNVATKTDGKQGNAVDQFFDRLNSLLNQMPNLEYLGIMRFAHSVAKNPVEPYSQCRPANIPTTFHLPKLRIFSWTPDDGTSEWTTNLINSAPNLHNASVFEGKWFSVDQIAAQKEPLLVKTCPLDTLLGIWLRNTADLEEWNTRLRLMAPSVCFLSLVCDEWTGFDDCLCLLVVPFPRVKRLYYRPHFMQIRVQSVHFPALRYVHIEYSGWNYEDGRIPFAGCVFQTVDTLVLNIHGNATEWRLNEVFPNLVNLIAHLVHDHRLDFLSQIFKSFDEGMQKLKNLRIECSPFKVRRHPTLGAIPKWEEICGIGTVPFSFQWATEVDFGGVELSSFLPIFVSCIRKGNFSNIETLNIRGYTRDNYGPHIFPNIEECTALLRPKCKSFKLSEY